jgi:hypothetical protein
LQRFLEGAPNRHRFADALHLRRQRRIGLRKFFEGETRHLHDAVVDRRLETRGSFARDVVPDFVERVTDRQLRRDLRDRKSGRFRGQRARARDTRVHFDYDHPAILGIDRELNIRAARLDSDLADHVE